MRISTFLNEDEIRGLANDKNTYGRGVLHSVVDKLIEIETVKVLKNPGINDLDFNKDIRFQIGVVDGLKQVKTLLDQAETHYGE